MFALDYIAVGIGAKCFIINLMGAGTVTDASSIYKVVAVAK